MLLLFRINTKGVNKHMKKKSDLEKKGKKSVVAKIFLSILWFFLGIICLLIGWFSFSALDKKDPLTIMPSDFSLFVHTDSIWDSINPIIDLKAADILLSGKDGENNMAAAREVLMTLRSSSLREKWYIDFALSRKVDASLYSTENSNDFIGIVDLSFLSGVTRLSKIVGPLLNIKNLSYHKNSEDMNTKNYFEYNLEDKSIFIKPYHNLIIVTNQKEYISNIGKIDFKSAYTEEQKALINEKSSNDIKILVDAKKLVNLMDFEGNSLATVSDLLKDESFGVVSFNLTDEDILVNAKLPLTASKNTFIKDLIENTPTVPSIISKLGNNVQYYTVLNAGSLKELKEVVMPMLPPEKEADKIWLTAESFCKLLFDKTIEELIFSWTGREFVAFGVEGLNSPIFAVQISDEKKRAQVFEDVFSSLLLNNDTSLIVDGVRLPRIKIPLFLQSVLDMFNISLSTPYYLIKDDFIYFSSSPECLSVVNSSYKGGLRLVTTENWKNVSVESNHQSTLELFYDLERSVPFFLRGDNIISDILQLYSMGLCEIQLSEENLNFALHSISRPTGNLRILSGFPISLENKTNPEFFMDADKSSKIVYWVENDRIVCSLNLNSMEIKRVDFQDKISIAVPNEKTDLKEGSLWVCTKEGTVYLLDKNLEIVKNFPIFTGMKASAECIVFGNKLVFPVEDGSICEVSSSGEYGLVPLITNFNLKAKPTVLDEYMAVYEKSFLGNIHILRNEKNIVKQSSMPINGIAYGSPAIIKKDGVLYTAFITQAGFLYIWKDGVLISEKPLMLFGIFYSNVVAGKDYFYAISANGVLNRISVDGEILKVQIPEVTVKNGYLTVLSPEENGVENIFVSVDGNIIYGFNQGLELLSGFPLPGRGKPLFVDVNSDKNADCLVFSLDNKITAWNLR